MKQRLALVLTLLVFAAAACAQQDFLRRPSPFAGRSMLTLSLFDEVRTEIKSTPDENSKIDALAEKIVGDMQEAFQGANGDMDAMQDAIEKVNAKYDAELAKVLTTDQDTRLRQLFIQYNGAGAIQRPDIAKDLGLTADELAKVKQAQKDERQKVMETFSGGGGGDPMEAIKKLNDEFTANLDKILTEDQRTKLKTMAGAKFEFKKG